MENKQIYKIIFRLFWDDEPVGFESWDYIMGVNYTHGDPTKPDGWKSSGWCARKMCNFNRKEIVDIKYVTQKFLDDQKRNNEFWKESFGFINDNIDLFNDLRAEFGEGPITKIKI
jgi:hypothetical protein